MRLLPLAIALTILLALFLAVHTITSSSPVPEAARGRAAAAGDRDARGGNPSDLTGRIPPRQVTPLRASRSRTPEPHGPFWKWVASAHALRVANCESNGNPRAVSRTGKYRGKWQMDADFWRTYGGLKYAPRPDLATESEQDRVAYNGWLARGWQPWSCR
jgi:hypothetical protein